jgi:imidazolonepropionase-like amidohydrolase
MSEAETWILGNGTLVTGSSPAQVVPQGAVAWTGERISAAGDEATIRARFPDAHYLDGRGGVIMPSADAKLPGGAGSPLVAARPGP